MYFDVTLLGKCFSLDLKTVNVSMILNRTQSSTESWNELNRQSPFWDNLFEHMTSHFNGTGMYWTESTVGPEYYLPNARLNTIMNLK
jgi:hypothetical protein